MKEETKELIKQSLQYARTKHPLFAENESAGVSIIGEEFGELCKAVNERDFTHAKSEALHIIATCIRYVEEL